MERPLKNITKDELLKLLDEEMKKPDRDKSAFYDSAMYELTLRMMENPEEWIKEMGPHTYSRLVSEIL